MCDCGMVPADTGKVGGGEEQMEVLKGVDVRCVTQPTPCVPLGCGTGPRCRRARIRRSFLACGANTRTRCRDGSASGSRHSVREPSVQAAADRRTERSDSDILVSEYHKVGVCARARVCGRMLRASAACRSPPPPARVCSLLLNLKRHGTLNVKEAHLLTPCRISDFGFRI